MVTPTTSVPGIGKATAFALSQHGYKSAEAVAAADEEILAAVPGFGVSRAKRVIESARKLVGVSVADEDAAPAGAVSTEAAKTKNKKKGKKKAGKSGGKKKSKQKKKKKGEKESGKAGKSKKKKKSEKK